MKISLLKDFDFGCDFEFSSVECDSRRVKEGTLFVALKGNKEDGAAYARKAAEAGAVAVVSDSPAEAGFPLPWLRVADARKALARLSCEINGNPSHRLPVYAVTGTNGKTTIAGLMRDCLEAGGGKCGLLSTVENCCGLEAEEASRTTGSAPEIQSALATMIRNGCTACSMEASSHALDQERTYGIRFAATGFTNLSRDHFDYHTDFENYFKAKAKLFIQAGEEKEGTPCVINIDDEYGRRLHAMLAGGRTRPLSYSLNGEADITAREIVLGAGGTSFTLSAFGKKIPVETFLLGRYNVSNMLCVAGMAAATGISLESVAETFSKARPRWGRLEKAAVVNGASVFVDYAHTPDAIEKVLTALREITAGKLTIVFGCGGDRDRAKRPQMAAAASRLADFSILTSDNPRTEDPEKIMDDAEAGFAGGASYRRIADRREAISAALDSAHEGDTIVIAGKGHENYQEINGVKHHFDDRETVREMAAETGK